MKRPIHKKWWFLGTIGLLIAIILTIAVPHLINKSYQTTQIPESSKYITEWTAADTLVYYGAVLSFIGTVVLGALAFWQNEKVHDTNKRLLDLEIKSKRGYFIPKNHVKVKDFPRAQYDHFIEDPGIKLLCYGDDNVLVSSISYTLCGRTVQDDKDGELFVPVESEFNEMFVPVKLNKEERALDSVAIEVVLQLKNSKMYHYTQKLYLGFEKNENEDGAYKLCSFNSAFSDEEKSKE